MKNFFYIVFGGLALFIIGIFVVKIGIAVTSAKPPVVINPVTSYSATQEEDNLNTTYKLWSSTSTTSSTSLRSAITAKSYIVMDINSGSVLASRSLDMLMPIASLTKLVTAVVAKKYIAADARIVISKDILNTYGNSAGFKEGETFTVGDLMYPLLMISSNDASEAIAAAYDFSGVSGRAAFIRAMNDFTQSIGAYRTYFADPAGLSPDSASTARDMAIILEWIYKNQPSILDVTLQETKTIRSHTWVNPTHLLSWSYYLGGKNGYTPEASLTGASLFKFGTATSSPIYAVVVLGSQSRDSDVVSLARQIIK